MPPSPVILWIELGGKLKWLLLNCGYHDVIRMALISNSGCVSFFPQRSGGAHGLASALRHLAKSRRRLVVENERKLKVIVVTNPSCLK